MKRFLFSLLLLFISLNSFAQSGTITTIAGDGIGLSTGDGGPAVNARVTTMAWGTFGFDDDFLFTEGPGDRVRRISRFGIIDSFIGNGIVGYSGDGGLARRAKLHSPAQTAQDKHGNWYIVDVGNHCIRKRSAVTGIITTIAGNGTCGYTGNGGPATAAMICSPYSICLDDTGNIFFFEQGNSVIRKIDTFGIISYVAGTLSSSGASGDGGPATAAQISLMACMRFDRHNNLYMTGFNIRKIDMVTGIISKVAGVDTNGYSGDGGPATAAAVNYPIGICFSNNGLLYIADRWNNRIRKIDSTGIITTVVGTGVAGFSGDGGLADTAKLYYPEGVAFDSCGNMYICDKQNYRIRKVTYVGGTTPMPTVSISGGESDTFCTGATVSYTATVTGGGTHFFYQWYVNGVLVSDTASHYSFIPGPGDSVYCRVSTYSNCNAPVSALSNVAHITLGGVFTVPSISISGPVAAAPGSTVTITATVASAGSYLIHWKNHGITFATTTVPSVSYTKGTGTDTITAFIVPNSTCYDSTLSAGHTVLPDNTSIISLGTLTQVQIWPVPLSNELHVKSNMYMHTIEITDLAGRIVVTGNYNTREVTINIQKLDKGLYFIRINNTIIKKIIKE